MSAWTDRIFKQLETLVPPNEAAWVSDMRYESKHIAGFVSRVVFMLGCLRLCTAIIVRDRIGVRRVGQTLLGGSCLIFTICGLVFTMFKLNPSVAVPLYGFFALYLIVGVLVCLNLAKAKQVSFWVGSMMIALWIGLGVAELVPAQAYIRALTLESAQILIAVHIAASFIDWSAEETNV